MTSNRSPTQCTETKIIPILKPADDQAFLIKSQIRMFTKPLRFCLYFIVLRGFAYNNDTKSYSTGSVATARDRSKSRRQKKRDVVCGMSRDREWQGHQ